MNTFTLTQLYDVFFDTLILRILVIILCLMVVHMIIKLLAHVAIRGLVRDKKYHSAQAAKHREATLTMVLTRTSASLLWITGIGLVLGQFDFNWAGLAAGAGVIGIVIGFGAQKIAGDFIAGLFILIEGQYDVGDVVEVVGMAYGTVERIDLRTTHIRNLDGGMHIIANSEIVNMANHSYGWAAALIYLQLDNETDLEAFEKVANNVGEELSNDKTWGKEIKTPIVFDRVEEMNQDGLKVRIMGNTTPSMQWAVAGEYKKRLKPALDKAGIAIAYPHTIIKKVSS